MASPPESDSGLPRRGFLAAGAGAFLCTIGGERVLLSKPGDAAKADAAARRVRGAARPRGRRGAPGAGPTEQLTFTTPQPQPGGTAREYWIAGPRRAVGHRAHAPAARRVARARASPGRACYRAFVYQQMTEGFAAPLAPAGHPGPDAATPRSATRSSCTSATACPRRPARR